MHFLHSETFILTHTFSTCGDYGKIFITSSLKNNYYINKYIKITIIICPLTDKIRKLHANFLFQ